MDGFKAEGINVSEKIEAKIGVIREQIDPNRTLPEVKLQISPENVATLGTLVHTKYDLKNGDNKVGEMSINTDKINHVSWIYPINIEDNYQGKGFGLATHVAVIEKSLREGNSLKTHDWSHTEGSKHIWETLAQKGVAKTIEPFKTDDNGKYIGEYEVTLDSINKKIN